jgi:predicted nuclease of predicted toxin-antitoxin system
MRLLFDQNLSHRLIAALADLFPGSQHVRLIGMAEAEDLSIWDYAKSHEFTIVTYDSDYADWNKLLGAPPQIVWLRCGNTSTAQIEAKLRHSAERIQLLADPDLEIEVLEIL